jgi:hypothetical protein
MQPLKQNKYKKIVIGVDQSYTKTGISVCIEGKLTKVKSIAYKGLKSHSEKRKEVSRVIGILLRQATREAQETIIICERIRTFSNFGNNKRKGGGLSPNYLKMTGALIACIVDTAFDFGVKVYSVDTRAWKSKVVGSAKARKDKDGKRDAKGETVEFIQRKGFNLFIRTNKNGVDLYDDDAADSACIALYGFINKSDQRLKLEE